MAAEDYRLEFGKIKPVNHLKDMFCPEPLLANSVTLSNREYAGQYLSGKKTHA
jgi:hypothetical protein